MMPPLASNLETLCVHSPDAICDDDDDNDDGNKPLPPDTIVVNANKYAQVKGRALTDGGANGGLMGSDMKRIS